MGGSEEGEPRRAAEINQPRLDHPAGWRGLDVACFSFLSGLRPESPKAKQLAHSALPVVLPQFW